MDYIIQKMHVIKYKANGKHIFDPKIILYKKKYVYK